MSPFSASNTVTALDLAAHLCAGIGFGALYFQSLRWTIPLFGDGPTIRAVAWMVGRFTLLGGVLALTAREGAPPLLAMAAGIVSARWILLRPFHKVPL